MANKELTIEKSGTDNGLQCGQIIRPILTDIMAVKLIEKLYGVKVKNMKELNSYDDRNYRIEVENTWNNSHVEELWPHGYAFKVLNFADSQTNHTDAEHEAAHILTKAGISCPIPVLNIHGKDKSLEKIQPEEFSETYDTNENVSYNWHICRLMKFVPGKLLNSVSYTPTLLYEAGLYTARIHTALQGFDHDSLHYNNYKTIWRLENLHELTEFVHAVRDDEYRKIIHEIIDASTTEVVPLYSKFKKGVIHADISDQNIIVQEKPGQDHLTTEEREYEISGIIDFGDSHYSYLVFDVAMAIMYQSLDSKLIDPLLVGGHILTGYLSKCTLNESEFEALKVCVAGRYAQSLTMGAYKYSMEPENDYLLITAKTGWAQLKKLWKTPKEELYKQWKEIIYSYKL